MLDRDSILWPVAITVILLLMMSAELFDSATDPTKNVPPTAARELVVEEDWRVDRLEQELEDMKMRHAALRDAFAEAAAEEAILAADMHERIRILEGRVPKPSLVVAPPK